MILSSRYSILSFIVCIIERSKEEILAMEKLLERLKQTPPDAKPDTKLEASGSFMQALLGANEHVKRGKSEDVTPEISACFCICDKKIKWDGMGTLLYLCT